MRRAQIRCRPTATTARAAPTPTASAASPARPRARPRPRPRPSARSGPSSSGRWAARRAAPQRRWLERPSAHRAGRSPCPAPPTCPRARALRRPPAPARLSAQNAIVDFTRPFLNRPYEARLISRDEYKAILKKVADKVVAKYQQAHSRPPSKLAIPDSVAAAIKKLIDEYIDYTRKQWT